MPWIWPIIWRLYNQQSQKSEPPIRIQGKDEFPKVANKKDVVKRGTNVPSFENATDHY